MSFPLVDPFVENPYQVWTTREKTPEEFMADAMATGDRSWTKKLELREVLRTPADAACHMAREGADGSLAWFIDDALSNSAGHAAWRSMMPPQTPSAIEIYQNEFPHYDAAAVDDEIARFGIHLPVGQVLFHGGLWMGETSDFFTTKLPLSTTLCPQVALREAEFNGKAYDAGQIHLLVLRIAHPSAKAFVFQRTDTNLGHENEVLFPSSVHLQRMSHDCLRMDHPVGKWGFPDKRISVFVTEVALVG
jgi:hypothetical protein